LIPQASGARCGFFYGPRFNVVNEEKRNQIYGQISREFSDTLTLGAELGYTHYEVLDNPQSPSFPNLAFPVILPGQAGSPFSVPTVWLGRPLGSDFPSPLAPRANDTWRAVLELDGAFSNRWTWNGAVTYSENERQVTQPDTIRSRLEEGLAGVGGPDGDQTFNVFDSSANSPEMISFMSIDTFLQRTADLAVFDFVTTGDLFEIGHGFVDFAAGAQYRHEGYSEERSEIYTQTIDPSSGEIIPVDLIFLGGGLPIDVDRQSYAIFAEMRLPVTESLEVNLAARYEALDSDDSLNPKLSIRWQATDSLVLRGSVSTAFREPSLIQFHGRETSLQGLQDFNPDGTPKGGVVFVRVNENGNLDLVSEESTNYNVGAIWSPTDSFDLRLDYWRFDYEDVITVDNAQGKIQDDLNGDDIIRVAGDNSQLVGVNVDYINAASVDTHGLDLNAVYAIPTNSMGDFGMQFTATHFLSYEIPTAAGGTRDVAGFFNHDNFARSIPKTKANLSFDWTMGSHSAAVSAFYVDNYATTRTVPPRHKPAN
jgi:iron complex outermembrane receptor protein